MRLIIAALLLASTTEAETSRKLACDVAAIALNAAATYLDMRSSLAANGHGYETSPLFRSGADRGFHARGIVGIWAITGAVSAAEIALWRRGSTWQTAPAAISGVLAFQHFRAARHNSELTKTP